MPVDVANGEQAVGTGKFAHQFSQRLIGAYDLEIAANSVDAGKSLGIVWIGYGRAPIAVLGSIRGPASDRGAHAMSLRPKVVQELVLFIRTLIDGRVPRQSGHRQDKSAVLICPIQRFVRLSPTRFRLIESGMLDVDDRAGYQKKKDRHNPPKHSVDASVHRSTSDLGSEFTD